MLPAREGEKGPKTTRSGCHLVLALVSSLARAVGQAIEAGENDVETTLTSVLGLMTHEKLVPSRTTGVPESLGTGHVLAGLCFPCWICEQRLYFQLGLSEQ
jgi:hypothetical protein